MICETSRLNLNHHDRTVMVERLAYWALLA
jgi:hypothetical protein